MSPTTIPHAILESRPKEVIIPNEAIVQSIKSGECGTANPRVQEQISITAENAKIATNAYDFAEMFKKCSYRTEERMALYLSDRDWVNERNILETFYRTKEPLTKKNMTGSLVDSKTVLTNLLLTFCLQVDQSVKVGSSIMSVPAIAKRYITAERAALNFYLFYQDSQIECSSDNAKVLEKIAHICFYHYRIIRTISAISKRSEFFNKFYLNEEGDVFNRRAAMLRIMVFICNLTADQFRICKEAIKNVKITAAYGKYMYLLPELLKSIEIYSNYPQNLLLKKGIKIKDSTEDDLFCEEQLEKLAASLFVEIRARITPEQVFIIFILVLSYDNIYFYRK